ncbi:MAG: NarK family nitrate/nitrite MFS transporter [Verrucomicrobia subdivision 3 bacterium]|nr:NarK family nitrate/nitrite MFS transporter [Limisphaerales bacterium]
MADTGFNLLNIRSSKIRTLHFTWFAFFLTFVVWFNHAPLSAAIIETFDLSADQWKALLVLNVALTIPSRVIIGMLVDKFGPRTVFSILLMVAGVLCSFFALAQTYEQLALARFMMGFVGAGFVIGIRLVGEWFPAKEVGLAEGIYGGWGNFGSAAAALTLPTIVSSFYSGADAWRYGVLTTGAVAFVYGIIFYIAVRNTPKGSTYFKPKKAGGLEVTSRKDFYFLLAMNLPMVLALGVLAWRLTPEFGVGLISRSTMYIIWATLAALYAWQAYKIYDVNKEMLETGVEEAQQYEFKQVAILNLNYAVTFGSELAVVSMLPAFFAFTFDLDPVKAGMFGACFAVMCLVARPLGGWLSDKIGRRKTMMVALGGQVFGYFAMSQINDGWPVIAAVVVTSTCAFFALAGTGAVFAMVPLIKRRLTGQIAGMTGAYGNVGGACFLTALLLVSPSTFFIIIAICSIFALGASWFLSEPAGHTVEVMEDGTVQLIEVG